MSLFSRTGKAAALLLSGAAVGAAGGLAVSASGAGQKPATKTLEQAATGKGKARGKSRLARLERAVSLTAVVPARGGRFTSVSIERGTLVRVTTQQLTLREGTRRASYETVTLAVGPNATVRLSRRPSTLGALSPGDRVAVVQGPRKTLIAARPAASARSTDKRESAAPSA
jgi:hypothetical protein